MKQLRPILAAAALLIFVMMGRPAMASQGSCVIPTTGTVSGLTLVQDINTCIEAIMTTYSAATAPANGTGAVALYGQMWLKTTDASVNMYDAASWLRIGTMDTTSHIWQPPVGGGYYTTLASGTTTDVCSIAASLITVTGTTTITSFSNTCATGQMKAVIFSGILTLTHNATSLILPNGGSNITTAAGDRAWLAYLGGGNWEVISYQRADGTTLSVAATIGAAQLLASSQGMNAPLNLRINASVAGSALTVSVTSANNSTPSSTQPVLIPFRDPTLTNGEPIVASLQSALTFTVASTNTLGTSSSNVPFRLWLIAYYNGGTVALGLFNASNSTTIFPLAEGGVVSTAASTNGGSSAGTHYANVSTIVNTPFRILGYFDWSGGLATAGTWASGPTTATLFGPGIKKPGDIVQTLYATTTVVQASSGAVFPTATTFTKAIVLTNTINPVASFVSVVVGAGVGGQTSLQIYRATGAFACTTAVGQTGLAGPNLNGMQSFVGFDQPGTVSSVTYGLCFGVTGSAGTANGGMMILQEIMGALEPANDNLIEPQRMFG